VLLGLVVVGIDAYHVSGAGPGGSYRN